MTRTNFKLFEIHREDFDTWPPTLVDCVTHAYAKTGLLTGIPLTWFLRQYAQVFSGDLQIAIAQASYRGEIIRSGDVIRLRIRPKQECV